MNPRDNRLNSCVNSQGTIPITYDPAGNMLTEGALSYAYNGAGRLSTVNTNAGIYRYDALGHRVKKTYAYQSQSGAVTGSIISVYGTRNELLADYKTETAPGGSNNSRTDYIVDDEKAVAAITVPTGGSPTTKYLYRNHLNQVIDPDTYTADTGRASLYGQPYGSGGDNQFPGHKDDPESGLHYNLARLYHPYASRWTTPDPIMANAYDPQSLNKYGYNRNDPVNRVDPNGREFVYNKDFIDLWWTTAMGMGGIDAYNAYLVSHGLMALPWYEDPDPAHIAYEAMVDQGQRNLAIQEAVEASEKAASPNPSPYPDGGFWSDLGDVVGKIWNAPNTAVGLAWGLAGLPLGADISIGHNAIQFTNHPFMPWVLSRLAM